MAKSGVLTLDPYLAEMRKSKRNQLTGGEATPDENVPWWAPLLCNWGLYTAAVGSGDEWAEERVETVLGAEAVVVAGYLVDHDGHQVWG